MQGETKGEQITWQAATAHRHCRGKLLMATHSIVKMVAGEDEYSREYGNRAPGISAAMERKHN